MEAPKQDSQHPNSSQQDDEPSQDNFDSFLSSLPRARGWTVPFMYKYQGFWHISFFLRGVLASQKHFEAKDTDIFLITPPKCGTTWLKAIMFTIVNRNRYPLTQEHPLLTKNPHELVPFMELNLYALGKIPDFSNFTSPRLLSTHVPLVSLPRSLLDTKCKLVYLCRNPKDSFVSHFSFANNFVKDKEGWGEVGCISSLEETFELFCKGVSQYGPFWDHVLGYWKLSCEQPEKIFFLKYEEMKEQPVLQLRRLAEFLEFPFTEEEEASGMVEEIVKLCSFGNLTSMEVNRSGKMSELGENKNYFRRGEVGDWKNFLSPEMANQLDSITQQKFQGSGLTL